VQLTVHARAVIARAAALLVGACVAALAMPILAQVSSATNASAIKTVRVAYQSSERGFDCAAESDEFTGTVCDAIFDPLLQYDHLARPIALQPRTAEALPVITDGGRTYTLRVRPGIYFTDHKAFGGRRRELTAHDYAYSLKRLLDPKVKAQWQFLADGKFEGLDELTKEAQRTGKFDYDRPVRGIEVRDRYTLILRLKAPDYNLSYILAMPATAAMAREVVEWPAIAVAENPVGTGAFVLKEWRRSSRIVLERNPNYRDDRFETIVGTPARPKLDARNEQIITQLRGKRLPLIDRIEIFVIEEDQPRWLAFLNSEHDYLRPIPESFAGIALPGGKLADGLAARGIGRVPNEVAWLVYTFFNMQDPVIGGYAPERIALRRAISMAYPSQTEIAILENGQSQETHSIIAPGMAGFVENRANWHKYNPARAKALLDLYGYIDRDGDGWRETPDGQPLVIDQASIPRQRERQRNELWQRAMREIGIRMTFNKVERTPDLRKQAQAGKVQMWTYGWIADYPDGENFLQLFWSKSIGGANYSMYARSEHDALYERAKTMPDSPERTALYQQMVNMLWVDNPWKVLYLKQGTALHHPWILNYKKHPFAFEPWRYIDVDHSRKPK